MKIGGNHDDEKMENLINKLNKMRPPIVPKKDIKPIEKTYTFQIGDIVTSTWNTYSKDDPCELDRLYKRKDGSSMARIIWKDKMINVPIDTLKYHKSHFRNDKLDQLGL
jgi:hypothetical protein